MDYVPYQKTFFFTILGTRIDEKNVIKRGCPPSFQKIPLNTFVFTQLYVLFE